MHVQVEFCAQRACGVLAHKVELVHVIIHFVGYHATERVRGLVQRLHVVVVEKRGVEAIRRGTKHLIVKAELRQDARGQPRAAGKAMLLPHEIGETR